MVKKYALRLRYRAVASDGTLDYVKSERVKPGERWLIRSHSFENETGARGTIRGFVESHGYNHYLWEQENPAAATLYWSEEDMVLTEGERLCVSQATCTSGDELQLLINGYLEYEAED